MAPKTCEAIGCKALLLPFGIFCDLCWAKVPSDVKRLIEKHYRPNQRRRSKKCEAFVAIAVRELLVLKTAGHHIPRDASFEWTDYETALIGEQPSLLEKG